MPQQVVFAERRLTHYRVPLLETLHRALAARDIELIVVHGQATHAERAKQDAGHLPWAITVNNRYLKLGAKELVWQPLPPQAAHADLIIVSQENSILSNYRLQLGRRFGGPKVAFLGHGANLQSANPGGLKEAWKRCWIPRVDWWFAYTRLSEELVARAGFPRLRITNIENAADTNVLKKDLASLELEEIAAERQRLRLEGMQVGIALGSLYAEKRLDFLLGAADRLHAANDNFRLLIVGDGPQRDLIRQACSIRPWCLWMGAKTGREKALYLALSHVMLNPGLVGLGILDSFVAGVPMVTTDCGLHSPEIAYLRQHENGVMTENDLAAFSAAVQKILADPAYRYLLAAECRKAADHYTVQNMAHHLAGGIERCLNMEPHT